MRFRKSDLTGILIILFSILCVYLAWLETTHFGRPGPVVPTTASIGSCAYINEKYTYVSQFSKSEKIYICGFTNEPMDFELWVYNNDNVILYVFHGSTVNKTIGYELTEKFSPGKYIVEIHNTRQRFDTTEFVVIE